MADVTVEDLNDRMTYDSVKNNMDMADEIVADYMEDQLKKNVVSGVFLSVKVFMQKAGRKLYRLYAETEEFLRETT